MPILYLLHNSSLIQTLLSVLEFHQISLPLLLADSGSRTVTAGWDFHPTPKIYSFPCSIIERYSKHCKTYFCILLSSHNPKMPLLPAAAADIGGAQDKAWSRAEDV